MKTTTRFPALAPFDLIWPHGGTLHRATFWPEVQFECQSGPAWITESPDEDACASAGARLDAAAWRRYLELVPGDTREFLERFGCGRLEALLVISRCPGLFEDLAETPALAAFIAAHASLRGTGERWDEINAVYERNGIYGVLDWLGLPSSRQTLGILRNIAEPDLPKRFLAPLRSLLWEPAALPAFEHAEALTWRDLETACAPMAA